MRNVRAVALVLLAGMLAAACGARLPSSEGRQAAAAILNAGSGAVSTVPDGGVPTAGAGPLATGGPVTGGGPAAGGAPGTGGGQPGTQTGGGGQPGAQSGSSCPTGGTDV